jgi:hypothetical protein
MAVDLTAQAVAHLVEFLKALTARHLHQVQMWALKKDLTARPVMAAAAAAKSFAPP